eukprot:GHVL01038363.1.p2 GENE.GHVL01038363.1~~GHVL01038363.1.p2  ORF type:complete len:506 (-),score=55.85 GHVL01038363.1:3028-4545(-)
MIAVLYKPDLAFLIIPYLIELLRDDDEAPIVKRAALCALGFCLDKTKSPSVTTDVVSSVLEILDKQHDLPTLLIFMHYFLSRCDPSSFSYEFIVSSFLPSCVRLAATSAIKISQGHLSTDKARIVSHRMACGLMCITIAVPRMCNLMASELGLHDCALKNSNGFTISQMPTAIREVVAMEISIYEVKDEMVDDVRTTLTEEGNQSADSITEGMDRLASQLTDPFLQDCVAQHLNNHTQEIEERSEDSSKVKPLSHCDTTPTNDTAETVNDRWTEGLARGMGKIMQHVTYHLETLAEQEHNEMIKQLPVKISEVNRVETLQIVNIGVKEWSSNSIIEWMMKLLPSVLAGSLSPSTDVFLQHGIAGIVDWAKNEEISGNASARSALCNLITILIITLGPSWEEKILKKRLWSLGSVLSPYKSCRRESLPIYLRVIVQNWPLSDVHEFVKHTIEDFAIKSDDIEKNITEGNNNFINDMVLFLSKRSDMMPLVVCCLWDLIAHQVNRVK